MSDSTRTDAIQRLLNGTYEDGDILVVSPLDLLDIIDTLRAEVNKCQRKPQSILADLRSANTASNGNSTAQRAKAKA